MKKKIGGFDAFLPNREGEQKADITSQSSTQKEQREGTIKDDGSTSQRTGSAKGLREGMTRVTFIASQSQVDEIRALAWYHHKSTKEIFKEMADMYLSSLGEDAKKAVKEYNKTK